MDFGKLENIIFVAAAGAVALFFLIMTFVIIGKGKRKRNAGDVVLCVFAALSVVLCAFMTVCAVFTGMTGNIRIDTTVDPVLFYHGGKVTELPLSEFFVLMSNELARDITIGVMVLAFITFGCDCIIANKRDKKDKKVKKEKPAKKQMTPEEAKRAAELEKIRRLGDAAVKKASGAADTAKAPTAPVRSGDVVRTAKREEEEEPDWLKAADAPATADRSGFVGLSHIDERSDFDTFDDAFDAAAGEPATVDGQDEKAWYEDDEPVPTFVARTEKTEPEPIASEPTLDADEAAFDSAREEYDAEVRDEADEAYPDGADAADEYSDEAFDGLQTDENGIVDGDDVKSEDDREADGAWYAQGGDDGITDGDDSAERFDNAQSEEEQAEDEYDDPPTAAVDADGAWYAQSGDKYEETAEPQTESDPDDGEYDKADRDEYIPKIRTIERAKPAAERAVRQTARTESASGARQTPAKKSGGASASRAKPAQSKTAKPTQKSAKSAGKAKSAQSDAKKLPVTRRYVILDKTSAVNIFSDYLKERDKAEKDKLTSSINTIIIK